MSNDTKCFSQTRRCRRVHCVRNKRVSVGYFRDNVLGRNQTLLQFNIFILKYIMITVINCYRKLLVTVNSWCRNEKSHYTNTHWWTIITYYDDYLGFKIAQHNTLLIHLYKTDWCNRPTQIDRVLFSTSADNKNLRTFFVDHSNIM